jgi:hypothetical protein
MGSYERYYSPSKAGGAASLYVSPRRTTREMERSFRRSAEDHGSVLLPPMTPTTSADAYALPQVRSYFQPKQDLRHAGVPRGGLLFVPQADNDAHYPSSAVKCSISANTTNKVDTANTTNKVDTVNTANNSKTARTAITAKTTNTAIASNTTNNVLQPYSNEDKILLDQHQPQDLVAAVDPMMLFMTAPPLAAPLAAAAPPLPGMPLLPLGVSGLPHARPNFRSGLEDGIRQPQCWLCCKYNPGRRIPPHWYDGGKGWVTKYFYDFVERNPAEYHPGTFRCQIRGANGQLCNEQVEEEDHCKGSFLWKSEAKAPDKMAKHLTSVHGLSPPPRREWATDLFDTEGCSDVLFCLHCNGARQMMALSGHEDTMHWGWCLFFGALTYKEIDLYFVELSILAPPWIELAELTRGRMIEYNSIDEGCCKTKAITFCCAPCSVAQTYRELAASGVWAGGICTERFENYGTIGARKPRLQRMM